MSIVAAGFTGPDIAFTDLLPLLVWLGATCTLLLLGSLVPKWPKGGYAGLAVTSSVAVVILEMVKWHNLGTEGSDTAVAGAVSVDRFSVFATIVVAVAVGLVSVVTHDHLQREGNDGPELYAMFLTAAMGAHIMLSANDLIVLFLGLETLSLSLYVLAASNRRREQSQEAGIKYFVLGGFASAFFLYGIAMIYGATGETKLTGIAGRLSSQISITRNDSLLLIGIGLLIVGLAFKVSAVPFHSWAPDVYEGSPSPVTAFMASAGKVAAFCGLLRILTTALERRVDDWRPVIWVLALLTVFVGSIMAVVQTNVKRMLAFSSVTHAGFILVGVEAAAHTGGDGMASSMTYLLLYSVLVIGSFTVVSIVAGRGDGATSLDDFRGLGRRRPLLALAFTVLLLAQAGVPFTAGFIAKFGVIKSAVEVHSYAIAIAAMVAAVIGAFLYLRIMVSMWLDDASSDEVIPVPRGSGAVVAAAVLFTLFVGVFPGWLLDAAQLVVTYRDQTAAG
jgi:NADH-quinone oxidoreductase subunit N